MVPRIEIHLGRAYRTSTCPLESAGTESSNEIVLASRVPELESRMSVRTLARWGPRSRGRIGSPTNVLPARIRLGRRVGHGPGEEVSRRSLLPAESLPINLPPLREREGDISFLASHFVRKFAGRQGKKIERIPGDAISSTNAGGAADVAFSAKAVLGVRRLSLL
jgi:hypothetical protein